MSNLSIKNVPEDVVAQLRARAKTNHRSLQGELLAMISAVARRPADMNGLASPRTGVLRGTKSIEQIAAEHRARQVEPIVDVPMAVDIVRRDRDRRS
ncbi:MAG TPA: Arc family DNA-binding protein [Wenzhouxiangella sp.]